jgi:hypothetical protein
LGTLTPGAVAAVDGVDDVEVVGGKVVVVRMVRTAFFWSAVGEPPHDESVPARTKMPAPAAAVRAQSCMDPSLFLRRPGA